jgi:regulatory factor X
MTYIFNRLKAVCRSAKNSVPRNRVYSHYAERCGTERVIPLNPASFGKLVRVIFPGIQTRRLGVRGESKYHYVDLALVDESQEGSEPERPQHMQRAASQPVRQASTSNRIDFK